MLEQLRFDSIDLTQMRVLLQLPPHERVRLTPLLVGVEARELDVKVLEKISRVERTLPGPQPVS